MGKLLVQKFGGSSLVNAERIEAVADIIAKTISEGNQVAVVLSAMGEETDKLIDLAKQIQPNPNLREDLDLDLALDLGRKSGKNPNLDH